MSLNRRRFNHLLLGALASAAGASLLPLGAAANLVEGRDWRPLELPQPPSDPGKIEVLEFFSYGCPHCAHLNPFIKPWAAALPPDVSFKRIPVSFGRAAWANLARLFFALELTGDLDRLDQAVFDAVTEQRKGLYTDKAIFDWVKGQGVDLDAFKEAFNGFTAETQLKRSDVLVQRYRVDAVPQITVAGRYMVVGDGVKDYRDLLAIADQLIAKTRAG
jgi:thiol:disulfide interchange protein DsbA